MQQFNEEAQSEETHIQKMTASSEDGGSRYTGEASNGIKITIEIPEELGAVSAQDRLKLSEDMHDLLLKVETYRKEDDQPAPHVIGSSPA